ncbi:MAG: hypothetical protein LUQ49_00590 [Methanomicrobiales archaeon]|nr:hypothetical protein [Methanomicrobiales archaeon]
MKTRLFVLIGFVALALVAMAGPVAAATTGTAYGYGTLGVSISISLNQTGIYLNLSPLQSPALNTSLGITVSSNVPGFHVTVRNSSASGPDIGFLGNWTSTGYQMSPDDTNLTQPLQISGTNNLTTTGNTVSLISAVGQNLFTGGGKVSTRPLATEFSQAVTMNDEVLPAGYEYRIDLEFTITPT